MPNRYNFASSGGAIVDSLHDMLAEHELQRRQMVEEAKAAEDLKLRKAADKRASDAAIEQSKTAEVQRRAAEDTLARNQRGDVTKRLGEVGMGGAVEGDLLEQAKRLTPEALKVTESHTQNTLPASTVDPNTGARTQFSQETPFTVADKTAFAGTKEERTNRELSTKMGAAKSRQEAVQIALDAGVPANQVDDVVNTIFKPKGNVWWQTRTGALQFVGPDGKPGPAPEGVTFDKATDTISHEPAPPGAGGGNPFIMAIPTAEGTRIVNGRDTSLAGQTFSLRPSAAQQQDLVNNNAAMGQITLLKDEFRPEFVGPLQGRYNSVYTRLLDDPDKGALARYQTRVASLKNRFVKAVTGAQMSEQEATRIMQELPDMNLPDTTFWARLDVAEQNLAQLIELQQQTYTGIRRDSKNAITEAQLNKIFPDSKFTGGATKDEKPAGGTAPAKSKYKVTVS